MNCHSNVLLVTRFECLKFKSESTFDGYINGIFQVKQKVKPIKCSEENQNLFGKWKIQRENEESHRDMGK